MWTRVVHIVAGSVVILTLPIPVMAQSLDSLDLQAASRICSRPGLRVTRLIRILARPPSDTTHGSIVGPLERCGDGVLVLGVYPGQEIPGYQIPAGTVQQVWVRGTQGTWGLLAGGVAGGAFGGLSAAAKTQVCSLGSPPVTTKCHGSIPVNAAIGAGVGALVGWVLGSGLPRWARVFP